MQRTRIVQLGGGAAGLAALALVAAGALSTGAPGMAATAATLPSVPTSLPTPTGGSLPSLPAAPSLPSGASGVGLSSLPPQVTDNVNPTQTIWFLNIDQAQLNGEIEQNVPGSSAVISNVPSLLTVASDLQNPPSAGSLPSLPTPSLPSAPSTGSGSSLPSLPPQVTDTVNPTQTIWFLNIDQAQLNGQVEQSVPGSSAVVSNVPSLVTVASDVPGL